MVADEDHLFRLFAQCHQNMALQNFTRFFDEQHIRADASEMFRVFGRPGGCTSNDPLFLQKRDDRITVPACDLVLGVVVISADVAHVCNETSDHTAFPLGQQRLARRGSHTPDMSCADNMGIALKNTSVPPLQPLLDEIVPSYRFSIPPFDLRPIRRHRNLEYVPVIRVFVFQISEEVVK